MPGSSNTSFIPKRNPTKNVRTRDKRQVFVGTFIIRILFFASLLAAAGVYVYDSKLKSDLNNEILRLDTAIAGFKEAEFFRVIEVDTRLLQAKDRLSHTASIVAILNALEKSTVSTAEITDLVLERVDDDIYELESTIKTDTFDSVMFQRSIFEQPNSLLKVAEIDDLTLESVPPNNALFESSTSAGESKRESVTFKALIIIDTEKISHQASAVVNTEINTGFIPSPLEVATPAASEETRTTPQSNQEGI